MAGSARFGARLAGKWRDFRAMIAAFGAGTATVFAVADLAAKLQQALPLRFPQVPVRIRVGLLAHPLTVRLFTTDVWVARQILFERQYRDVESAGRDAFVIDLGAYIGAYAALVLSARDDVRVVAVEPDPANAAIARRNLAPYGDRATLLATAVWNEPVPLRIENYGPATEWGVRVRPCVGTETPHLRATTIGEILRRAGRDRIDILKMDIEGGEEQVFRGDLTWLDAVELLAIELHGPAATRTVKAALAVGDWSREERGEVHLFRRNGRGAAIGA